MIFLLLCYLYDVTLSGRSRLHRLHQELLPRRFCSTSTGADGSHMKHEYSYDLKGGFVCNLLDGPALFSHQASGSCCRRLENRKSNNRIKQQNYLVARSWFMLTSVVV
ncbi:hypothetical protein N431DRAFT_96089 [Stipitochalara longipes BDJ]|nr:hypothetical protein N431DRAFT_96089 [Stipitochalara longipes BDJ]